MAKENMPNNENLELCGFGCGRIWNEPGGPEGFEDCVSMYHSVKPKTSWEEEFDNMLFKLTYGNKQYIHHKKSIKDFISSLRDRDKKELLEKIDNLDFNDTMGREVKSIIEKHYD